MPVSIRCQHAVMLTYSHAGLWGVEKATAFSNVVAAKEVAHKTSPQWKTVTTLPCKLCWVVKSDEDDCAHMHLTLLHQQLSRAPTVME